MLGETHPLHAQTIKDFKNLGSFSILSNVPAYSGFVHFFLRCFNLIHEVSAGYCSPSTVGLRFINIGA